MKALYLELLSNKNYIYMGMVVGLIIGILK